MSEVFESVVRGNVEAIDQCTSILNRVCTAQYCAVCSPVHSSIGEHIRHILDIFRCVMLAYSKGPCDQIVDYDKRRRGALCEKDIGVAKSEFVAIRCWLKSLEISEYSKRIKIKTEVGLTETEHALVGSSLLRELIFVSSHAVHHLAIISIIARLLKVDVGDEVGLAPATASYLRSVDAS